MIVLYKMDSFSYFLAKRKVKLKWVSLVNIIMNQEVVPEYIQVFDETEVLKTLEELLDKKSGRYLVMRRLFKQLKDELSDPSAMTAPSTCLQKFL